MVLISPLVSLRLALRLIFATLWPSPRTLARCRLAIRWRLGCTSLLLRGLTMSVILSVSVQTALIEIPASFMLAFFISIVSSRRKAGDRRLKPQE